MFTRSILIQIVLVMLVVGCSAFSARGMGSSEPRAKRSQSANGKEQKALPQLNEKAKEKNYVPDQVIVRFAEGTDIETINAIGAETGLEIIELVYKPNVYLMKILTDATVERIIERLRIYREVIYSEPNYIRRID